MQTDFSDSESSIDALEQDFLKGDVSKLKHRNCPICGAPRSLVYSVASQLPIAGPPGRRIKVGISIYCTGDCDKMISHMDGYCPAWAESIYDWQAFSQQMYEDR